MKKFLLFALVGLLALGTINSCEEDNPVKEKTDLTEEPNNPNKPNGPAANDVVVTGVTLDKTTLELIEGANETLTATVAPDDATNKDVTWSSSDSAIATVNIMGKVTAVKAGSAVIVVATSDGGKTATCTVTVTGEPDEPSEPKEPDNPENSTDTQGMLINGITWATRNVGEKGQFVDNPEDFGLFYSFTGAKTACPSGWRTPTAQELNLLAGTNSEWTTLNGVSGRLFGSGANTIFLPAAGYRDYHNGSLNFQGTSGYYWSSTEHNNTSGYKLHFTISTVLSYDSYSSTGNGLSVRCVRDNEIPDDLQEVTMNDITWATRNVGEKGQFMNNIEDYGGYYSFDEANTACPTGWRTPTAQEFEVLVGTNSEWIYLNGKAGRRFGNGNQTIFLPAAGSGGGSGIWDINSIGGYWSSTAYNSTYGYFLGFNSSGVSSSSNGNRSPYLRLSVRCVRQ
jgi:uncharacterized protein (TIGR02145 family)